jgi:uncharacterized protein (TIGR00251 family)
VVVEVWVVPASSRNGVDGFHDGLLRVRVTDPPEAGRANAAAARVVAEFLGARRAAIVSGGSSRRKQVLVEGVAIDEARSRLQGLVGSAPD